MAEIVEGSPEWWLRRLYARLIARRPTIMTAAAYFDGAHNLAFASKKFTENFGGMFKAFSDNWCGVVVGACEERLNPLGFRVDEEASADHSATEIWQHNDMDAQAQIAHTDALAHGVAYATAWIGGDSKPEITVSSAMQTIVETHPKIRKRRLAGLRCWRDEYGYEHAELFLPGDVYLFKTEKKQTSDQPMQADQTRWVVDKKAAGVDDNGRMVNPLGVVPVVEFLNKPRLYVARQVGWGVHSELASIIPLQDATNKLMADLLIASEFSSFPQRWLTGYEVNEDPATKAPIDPDFKSGPGRLWWTEDPEAKFGSFPAADLTNYVQSIELVVQHIASISATPPHYLRASADRLSGESLKSAETGLVAKVRRKMTHFGDGWEDVMRLAGKIDGNERLANASMMETVWRDPESRTDAELADSVTKKKAMGVPWQQCMEDLGYTPTQIERMRTMRADDALDLALNPPPPTIPAAAPTEPVPVG